MFNKKRMGNFPNPYNAMPNYPMTSPMVQPMAPPVNAYQMPNPTVNSYDISRLQTEINENKRLINELIKRINRLETYLGIRDGHESNY